AIGCGAVAGSRASALSTSQAARWCTSTPPPPPWWRARSSGRAATTGAARALPSPGPPDFAGATVVHVNAAAAALVAAAVLGPRRDYGRQALLPHNVPFVLLGAALLWFGWLGCNAGR